MFRVILMMLVMFWFFLLFNLCSFLFVASFLISVMAFGWRWYLLHTLISWNCTGCVSCGGSGGRFGGNFRLWNIFENGFDFLVFILKSLNPLEKWLKCRIDMSLQLLRVHFKSISNYNLNILACENIFLNKNLNSGIEHVVHVLSFAWILYINFYSEVLYDTVLRLPDFLEHQQRPENAHGDLVRTNIEWKRFFCCFRLPESLRLPFVCYHVKWLEFILLT